MASRNLVLLYLPLQSIMVISHLHQFIDSCLFHSLLISHPVYLSAGSKTRRPRFEYELFDEHLETPLQKGYKLRSAQTVSCVLFAVQKI